MSVMHKVVSRLSRSSLIDNMVYTARHGPARGLKRQGGLGWLPGPESNEERFFSRLQWEGLTVYDIGGDQGLFSLFFARAVGKGNVVVFEPNPQSCERIKRNLALNQFQNTQVIQMGLGEKKDIVSFVVPFQEPARGSAVSSMTDNIRKEGKVNILVIQVNSLDDEIQNRDLRKPDFIKLDVEGMEYSALLGMRETLKSHPRMSIEIHGADFEKKEANAVRVVRVLEDAGYQLKHLETGKIITSDNAGEARVGHLYCT